MFLTTEHRNGAAPTEEMESQESLVEIARKDLNGHVRKPRLKPAPVAPAPPEEAPVHAGPALAVFCYEDPTSVVGRFVIRLAAALAARKANVHVFCRKEFDREAPGVTVHALGELTEGELLAQVQEFTRRACNAFLQQFQDAPAHVTVLGFEWSSVQALSILRGIKNLDMLVSFHSLERQRSDLSSEISQRIEEIELSGLREAKVVLVHEPGTAAVAKACAPECADRIVPVCEMFPAEQFNAKLDPGSVKARYQVGPIDPTILFVGDLSERYGPDLLVKAMPPILKNHPQARLVIVGDGSLYWPLRVYTRYLLLEHAVRLVGHVGGQALAELVQAADVIVLPSRDATPWWPILAAWAAGRPVVATHAAAPAFLEHDYDSVLFYPSENSCVWGVERVLYDLDLTHRLAQNGRQKLDDGFGWNAVAAQVEELMGVAQS
jgi:glycosyltransferase involved in cell wall biosynthesis